MKKLFKKFIGVLIILTFVIVPVIFFTNKNMEREGIEETFNEEVIDNNTKTDKFFNEDNNTIEFKITKTDDSTDEIDSSSYDFIKRLINLYPQVIPYVDEALLDGKITKHENSRIWEFYTKHISEPEERKKEEKKKKEIKEMLRNGG